MKKAFSLIELIVCIAIILVLASLMFPVFGVAKNKAKLTVCISNLRQIGAALKLYQTDYGEYPPNTLTWPAFKPYFPTMLSCWANKEQWPEISYWIQASPLGDQKDHRDTWNEYLRCRDVRASNFPIAIDQNHTSSLDPQSVYLILREDGGVHASLTSKRPERVCDEMLLGPFINH